MHFAELSKIENKGIDIFELTSNGLTHINETYSKAKNSFCVGVRFIDLNFGEIAIEWANYTMGLSVFGIEGRKVIGNQLIFY